jgi:5-(carboxyamino)imidazole ribonucleotide mutase
MASPLVGIIMGSSSDAETMSGARDVLDELKVAFEFKVVSAHRMPDEMFEYAAEAKARGLQVIIAGAGGAAHLPGMVATKTVLPVIGVPVRTQALDGLDSLLSIVQMPKGVPVATVGIGNAANAALLAARILALHDDGLAKRLEDLRQRMHAKAAASTPE